MNDNTKNIISSLCGTTVAELVTLPVCTIKTNYQTVSDQKINNVIKSIYYQRGLKGFYSASVPAISAQVISTTGKYTLYRLGTSYDIPRIPAGILSGIAISIFTHPLDFVRVSLQRKESVIDHYQKSGIKIFYRGYSKNITKVMVASSLYLPVYDFTKDHIDNSFVAALTSAIISTTLIQPFDYIKTRNIAGVGWYQGLNPQVYFRGCSLNLLRIVPHFIIVMTLTEFIKSSLVSN